MQKIKKYIVALMVFVIIGVGFPSDVKADRLQEGGIICEGSELTQEKTSTVILENSAKGNILNKGLASVTDNGNGIVNVSGTVYGSVVCDKMILEMTLQRYSNGAWINVKTFSDTAYNTGLLTKSYNVKVAKGYYYRVKAACIAQKNGVSESRMPVTNGILRV